MAKNDSDRVGGCVTGAVSSCVAAYLFDTYTKFKQMRNMF